MGMKGVKLGTVRGGNGYNIGIDDDGNGEDVDEEEDGVDQEGITSYALDHNNQFLVTCSRNNMVQQYSVSSELEEDDDDDDDEMEDMNEEGLSTKTRKLITKTKLLQTWGRSGHSLPVTIMAYHDSNIFLATGSVDGTISIHNLRDGSPDEKTLNNSSIILLNDHLSGVTCMDWWSSSSSSTTTGNNDN